MRLSAIQKAHGVINCKHIKILLHLVLYIFYILNYVKLLSLKLDLLTLKYKPTQDEWYESCDQCTLIGILLRYQMQVTLNENCNVRWCE